MSSTTYFVHGPNGLHEQQNPDGSWESVVTDGLGNIRSMVDADLNVLESRQYDPFGGPYGATGDVQTPFGFTGEMTDPNGLVYLRARYYNPTTGTFLSLDPMEGQLDQPMSLNRYSYVQGDPVNRVDPSGMCPQPAISYAPQSITQTLQAASQSGNPDSLRRVVEAINTGCVSTGTWSYANAQSQQNCNCLQEALYGLDRFWQCIQRCWTPPTPTPPSATGAPSVINPPGGCVEDPRCGTRCTCEAIPGSDIENPPLPGTPMSNVTRTCRFRRRAKWGPNCEYECNLTGRDCTTQIPANQPGNPSACQDAAACCEGTSQVCGNRPQPR